MSPSPRRKSQDPKCAVNPICLSISTCGFHINHFTSTDVSADSFGAQKHGFKFLRKLRHRPGILISALRPCAVWTSVWKPVANHARSSFEVQRQRES